MEYQNVPICPKCNGQGRVVRATPVRERDDFGNQQTLDEPVPCPDCGGSGRAGTVGQKAE